MLNLSLSMGDISEAPYAIPDAEKDFKLHLDFEQPGIRLQRLKTSFTDSIQTVSQMFGCFSDAFL